MTAASPVAAKLMAADELLKLPTGMGAVYELVRGILKTGPAYGRQHGQMAVRLAVPLLRFVQDHKLGMVVGAGTGFILARDPDTVRAPDVGFVCANRLPDGELPDGYFPGAPDLAVEVVAPHDTASELVARTSDFFDAGTRQVWVAYPDLRQIVIFPSARRGITLSSADTLDGGDLLPGFSCTVAEIFD